MIFMMIAYFITGAVFAVIIGKILSDEEKPFSKVILGIWATFLLWPIIVVLGLIITVIDLIKNIRE